MTLLERPQGPLPLQIYMNADLRHATTRPTTIAMTAPSHRRIHHNNSIQNLPRLDTIPYEGLFVIDSRELLVWYLLS